MSPETATPSVSVVAQRFLHHCRAAKNLAPNTLRAYAGDLRDFASHIGAATEVGSIDRDAIRRYAGLLLDERRLKPTTVRRRMATLKVLFRWLEREEIVPLSVFHRLDLSIRVPRRLPRTLDAPDMRRLVQTAEASVRSARPDDRHDAILAYFAVAALFTTGLRIGELVSIRVPDISESDWTVRVRGKGSRERRVYLVGAPAVAAARAYSASRKTIATTDQRLLLRGSGVPVTEAYMRRVVVAMAKKAGLARRITPHMLRHTAATQLLEAGVDTRYVQRLLGHASIATTQIYTAVSDASLRDRIRRADTLGRLLSDN